MNENKREKMAKREPMKHRSTKSRPLLASPEQKYITERDRYESRLLTLHTHASQLNSAEEIDIIVRGTLDAMEFTLGFERACFLLVEKGSLQIKGSIGRPIAFSAQPLEGRGTTVKAANTKTTLRISDTRKEPAYVDPKGYGWTGPPTVLSELLVPVLIDTEAIAVLCVDNIRPDAFNDEDQRLLETLAIHVGSALGRLRHEMELKKSEERYHSLFQNMMEGVAYCKMIFGESGRPVDFVYIDVNNAFSPLTGLEDVVGKKVSEVIPGIKETNPELFEIYGRVASTGKPEKFEVDVKSLGISLNVSVCSPAKGDFVAVFENITERKRLEEELRQHSLHLEELVDERTLKLRESEEKYRELFEASPISLWEADFSAVKQFLDELRQKGVSDFGAYFANHPKDVAECSAMVKILSVNKATLDLYNAKSVNEIIGVLTSVLAEESNRNQFSGELVALAQGKNYHEAEMENRTLQGETKYCNVICTVVPGYEQSLTKVLISIVDLTPQKKLEAELRAARERLEYVVASNPAVLFLEKPFPDLSNTFSMFVSESATSVLGFEPKNFLGEPGSEFFNSRVPPDDLAQYLAEIPSLWSDGYHTFEFRFLHSDGVYRWIREEMKVNRDAEGRILDVVGVGIDVTERKKLEERLSKVERLAAIGETAAMVGHDLRNPLQGIAGALHLLKQESLTAEERNEMVQVIDDCVHYSDAIVRDLSDYSAEIELKLAEATPKSIMRDATGTVKIPQNVTMLDVSEDQPTLRVDPERMKRMIINLIQNAIDAMPQGGTLTISSKQSNDGVEIIISDTGSGMPKKILENLWKPLQTTKAKGLGLGLAICKRITDAHGGTLSMKSKAGEGTAVTIRLPNNPPAVEVKQK